MLYELFAKVSAQGEPLALTCGAGGKPSTGFPPDKLVEHSLLALNLFSEQALRSGVFLQPALPCHRPCHPPRPARRCLPPPCRHPPPPTAAASTSAPSHPRARSPAYARTRTPAHPRTRSPAHALLAPAHPLTHPRTHLPAHPRTRLPALSAQRWVRGWAWVRWVSGCKGGVCLRVSGCAVRWCAGKHRRVAKRVHG